MQQAVLHKLLVSPLPAHHANRKFVSAKFSINIPWDWSEETIIFDTNSPPEIGQNLSTCEIWPEYDNLLVTYVARLTRYKKTGTKHQFCLSYSLNDNPKLEIHELCWGTSTVEFDTQRLKCKATWLSSPPDKKYDGTAHGKVIPLTPIQVLEYEAYTRIKRKQQEFKSALLGHTKNCELTGESASSALDAAHIIGVSNYGTYSADNGLLLRADLHRLFDANQLRINPRNGHVSLSKSIPKDSAYRDLIKDIKLNPQSLKRVRSNLEKRKREG